MVTENPEYSIKVEAKPPDNVAHSDFLAGSSLEKQRAAEVLQTITKAIELFDKENVGLTLKETSNLLRRMAILQAVAYVIEAVDKEAEQCGYERGKEEAGKTIEQAKRIIDNK